MKNENWRLCYVEQGKAYFVECFETAWGDDWDDAPYEHNAGEPYGEFIAVHFSGDWYEPCARCSNSPYSVQDINAGKTPWLMPESWAPASAPMICAGVTLAQFIDLIHAGEGEVYIPVSNILDFI